MKRIPLTQGKVALVSDRDYWLVRQFKWRAALCGTVFYAKAWVGGREGYLHRLIAGFPPFRLDHKNGNGLDNRRSNLRPASHAQNMANRGMQRNNKTGFKGVSKHSLCNKFVAHITVNRKAKHLGLFHTPKEAHAAYVKALAAHHGEFAKAA